VTNEPFEYNPFALAPEFWRDQWLMMWGNGLTAQLVWTGNSNPTVGFRAIIEWSADCNSDGIVDYGQIRAGEIEDANGNNIPDCCEQGVDCFAIDLELGLEAHFEFEGTTDDSSIFGRDALANLISFTPDLVGNSNSAARFDGVQSYMVVEEIPIPTNNAFSWAVWVRCDSLTSPNGVGIPILERIETIGNNLMSPTLFVRPNGGVGFGSYSFATGGSTIETSSNSVRLSEWVHIVGTSTLSGVRRVFVNGILVGEGTSPNYGQPLPRLLVGRDRIDSVPRFRGAMDDLRVYSRALSTQEVQALFALPEQNCSSDIDQSGTVNAVDLAAILTVWGTDGGKYPRADINGDGEVNGPDLAAVLSNWGSCP
jgi:hypothetical protein